MISIRKSAVRGHADHGWLDTWHTFSFAGYYDPAEMGWGVLRVINEDFVQPGRGFGTHGHRDMEIVTYVLEGALEHKDSMGNGTVIRPGEVQRMSAGTGVLHSEYNPSHDELVHLLQIWIEPAERGVAPSYEQTAFAPEDKRGRLRLIASRDGREGSVAIRQDAALYASLLAAGEEAGHVLAPGRLGYVHAVRGVLEVNGQRLATGDGAKIRDETALRFTVPENASGLTEFLLFDLPA